MNVRDFIEISKETDEIELVLIQLKKGQTKFPGNYSFIKEIVNIVNCSFFLNGFMNHGQIIGRSQGYFEDGSIANNKPDKDGWIDVIVTKKSEIVYGDFDSWDYEDVRLGFSCAGIIIENGKRTEKWSSSLEYLKKHESEKTYFIQFEDGFLGIVKSLHPNTTNSEVIDVLLEKSVKFCAVLDGGGSSTGKRKVPNCLALVIRGNNS